MEMRCDRCGAIPPAQFIVFSERADGAFNVFCVRCARYLKTCHFCKNCSYCGMMQDPDPMPKEIVVQQIINTPQGQMTVQQAIPNPERLKKFCNPEKCKCVTTIEGQLYCCKMGEYQTCCNYDELVFERKEETE